MLRALGEVLRPGGRMAFFTIYVTPGLADEERGRAEAVGPSAVASPADHLSMLGHAGFVDVAERDLTAEFIDTTRAWLRELDARAESLAAEQPEGAFEQRQVERRAMLAATEEGLLRRALFVATKR